MSHYIHFKDPNSPEMLQALKDIPACPGVCIFMDLNRSTDIKYSGGIEEWGRKINNTFNFLLYSNHLEKDLVKGIGDEIMLYLPDTVLASRYPEGPFFSLLQDIYSSMYTMNHHPDGELFLNCKVALHHCTKVYNITFIEGANDYYGCDIDLTARLMSKGQRDRIVISEVFLEKVRYDQKQFGITQDAGCMAGISEKYREQFRGVPVETGYRTIDVM